VQRLLADFYLKILIFILIQITAYYLVIKNKSIFKFYEYHQIQKTHHDYTPRIGGLIIFLVFYLCNFTVNNFYLNKDLIIFVSGLIIVLIGTKEDLFSNVKAKNRLLTILGASVIVILPLEYLPIINIPIIEKIFEYKFISIIFFSLCLTIIANGINIIDGLNGHASLTLISSALCIIYLDFSIIKINNHIVLYLIFLFFFFLFNFPIGKIFLGDAGAYWLGWFLAIYVINFFAANKDINNWYAVVIFFYPAMEVLFSFTRKVFLGRSPFKPDLQHIHLKMYHYIKSKNANPLATLFLMPLSISPPIYLFLNIHYGFSIFLIIFLQIIIYFLYFIILPNPKEQFI